MRPKKYVHFSESMPFERLSKHFAKDGQDTRFYVSVTCPHCEEAFTEIAVDNLKTNKASNCKKHLLKCKAAAKTAVLPDPVKRKYSDKPSPSPVSAGSHRGTRKVQRGRAPTDSLSKERMAVIYCLILKDKRVYVGKTCAAASRFSSHATPSSGCRLVREAFQKHGKRAFRMEILLRCKESDADANESMWIIKANTLFPEGYNLRHGAMAGVDTNSSNTMVNFCPGDIQFQCSCEDAEAEGEAWAAVEAMLRVSDDDLSLLGYEHTYGTWRGNCRRRVCGTPSPWTSDDDDDRGAEPYTYGTWTSDDDDDGAEPSRLTVR